MKVALSIPGPAVTPIAVAACLALLGAACGDDGSSAFTGSGGGGGESATASTTTGASGATTTGTSTTTGSSPTTSSSGQGGAGGETGAGQGGGDGGGGPDDCSSAPDEDRDGDGFTSANGDCDDCDVNVNPGAIEVVVTEPGENGMVPEPADEDCDGRIDNPPVADCDAGLALDSSDPLDGAAAIDLCKTASGPTDWGLVSATYMRGNGTPVLSSLQLGIQSAFGPNVVPQGGASMLGISSGHARLPGQADACGACDCGGELGSTPNVNAFPQTSPECGGGPGTPVYDDIALEVTLRAPSNATGIAFDFFFYTFEYPDFICSEVNDQFIAWMQPPPPGVPNGNISFDATGNPISVNAAFFQVCAGCALGEAQMVGTGFDEWTCAADDGAAGGTGWLTTQAPVVAGEEVSIRFAIWDTGDSILDSTTLIDNVRWIANGGNVDVVTTPR